MKKLNLLVVGLCFTSSVFAGDVKVHIPLSPAGSFDAKAKIHNGVAMEKKGKFFAKDMYVVAKELKTGIDLRDEHLWDRLKTKKYPKIKVLKATGKGGRGIASVDIRGVKQKVPFTYKMKGKKADFKMKVDLNKFKFDNDKDRLSYMGIGVKNELEISGELDVKKKK